MRTDTGWWDRLFGRKVTMMLPTPHGVQPVRVSEKWLRKMKADGKVTPLSDNEVVRANIIEPWTLEESLTGTTRPLVRVEFWKVGEHIPRDALERKRDPTTGEIYVLYNVEHDKRETLLLARELWEQAKNRLRAI